jgi:hypothetical protein
MPDGTFMPAAWPILLDEVAAARFCGMRKAAFRLAVEVGLFPAGRTPEDLARAGLLPPERAARLTAIGAIFWHRGEIEARVNYLWGLEGAAEARQAAGQRAAREALDAFKPPAPRQSRQPRR